MMMPMLMMRQNKVDDDNDDFNVQGSCWPYCWWPDHLHHLCRRTQGRHALPSHSNGFLHFHFSTWITCTFNLNNLYALFNFNNLYATNTLLGARSAPCPCRLWPPSRLRQEGGGAPVLPVSSNCHLLPDIPKKNFSLRTEWWQCWGTRFLDHFGPLEPSNLIFHHIIALKCLFETPCMYTKT